MRSDPASSRAGRPTTADAARLESRLRESALEVFLEHGYAGTTMEAVARAADITKRTLYARYPDKRTLFSAVVRWAMGRRQDEPGPEVPAEDLAGALRVIARASVARALDPELVRLSRMAMSEAARFPEFARSAESLAWSPRIQAVAEVLTRHSERGAVVVEDVELAAEQFLAMVAAIPARLAAFGVTRPPEVEERHLEYAVNLFLWGVAPR